MKGMSESSARVRPMYIHIWAFLLSCMWARFGPWNRMEKKTSSSMDRNWNSSGPESAAVRGKDSLLCRGFLFINNSPVQSPELLSHTHTQSRCIRLLARSPQQFSGSFQTLENLRWTFNISVCAASTPHLQQQSKISVIMEVGRVGVFAQWPSAHPSGGNC